MIGILCLTRMKISWPGVIRLLKNLIIGILVGLCLPVQALAQTINNQQNPYYAADAINPQSSTYGGSTYAGELYNNTQGEGAQQFRESGFINAVSTVANANACLGATGAGFTMTPTACVAYDAGFRNAETGSITFPSNGTYWVAIDSCSQTGPPTSLCTQSNPGLTNFTRVNGTHYLIDGIDVSKPAMATNSQLLMRVVVSGGAITAVTDERTLTPNNLGGNYVGPVEITGNQTNGGDQINQVSVNKVVNALDFSGGDIGAQVLAAASYIESNYAGNGTIFIPTGTYSQTTDMALGKAGCNITVAGDSRGGTILKPTSALNGSDAFSIIDPIVEAPSNCYGGIRDLQFVASSPIADNFNAIHFSNVNDPVVENVVINGFNGASQDDSAIYIDTGSGTGGATFTENIFMSNVTSYYNSYMVTMDGKNTGGSINNEIMTQSHCDTAGAGACIYYKNMEMGEADNSYFDFNADMSVTGAAAMRANLSASNVSAVTYNVRAQSTLGSGQDYLFDASSGTWPMQGYAVCAGNTTCYQASNSLAVQYLPIPSYDTVHAPTLSLFSQTNSSGVPHAPNLIITDQGAMNGDSSSLSFSSANGSTFDWGWQAAFGVSGAQSNFCAFDGVASTFPLCIAPSSDNVVVTKFTPSHMGCVASQTPTVSSGTIDSRSSDSFGTISGINSGTTTLTFHTGFNGPAQCVLTDQGQPLLWATQSTGTPFASITFACSSTIGTYTACSNGQSVTYFCTSLGAP